MEKKLGDICSLKEQLIHHAQTHAEVDDPSTYGQVIDMIKDCFEMEKDCWKACYYKEVVESMRKEKENGGYPEGPYGYDPWRYPSSGRFASKGHGTRMGYIPMDMMPGQDPMFGNDWYIESGMNGPYGYGQGRNSGGSSGGRGGRNSGSSGRSDGNSGGSSSGRYGYPMDGMRMDNPYDRYLDSRRHYHESKNPEDRKAMDQHAKEHVEDVEETLRDIWEESSPELRKEMKRNLTNLVNSLPA